MGRKEFGMGLAKIKIKTGRSGKLFKHLKSKLDKKEMNDVIRANKNQNVEVDDAVLEEQKDKFTKPLENLNVEELNFVLFEIITSDDKLNNGQIDINKMKEITIKE
eukprot:62970_1